MITAFLEPNGVTALELGRKVGASSATF